MYQLTVQKICTPQYICVNTQTYMYTHTHTQRTIHNFLDWCWHLIKNELWAYWPPSSAEVKNDGAIPPLNLIFFINPRTLQGNMCAHTYSLEVPRQKWIQWHCDRQAGILICMLATDSTVSGTCSIHESFYNWEEDCCAQWANIRFCHQSGKLAIEGYKTGAIW
jgi:hypothetical protein